MGEGTQGRWSVLTFLGLEPVASESVLKARPPKSWKDGVGCLGPEKGAGREGQQPGLPGIEEVRKYPLIPLRGSFSNLPSEGLKKWWLLSQGAGRLAGLGVCPTDPPLHSPLHPQWLQLTMFA